MRPALADARTHSALLVRRRATSVVVRYLGVCILFSRFQNAAQGTTRFYPDVAALCTQDAAGLTWASVAMPKYLCYRINLRMVSGLRVTPFAANSFEILFAIVFSPAVGERSRMA